MADEFIKGLGIFTGGGLVWMTLASWYRTPGFESTQQLVAPTSPAPGSADLLNSIAIMMMDVFFWFTLIGALTFWVGIPAAKRAREALGESQSE